jgi:hypothetical protein
VRILHKCLASHIWIASVSFYSSVRLGGPHTYSPKYGSEYRDTERESISFQMHRISRSEPKLAEKSFKMLRTVIFMRPLHEVKEIDA